MTAEQVKADVINKVVVRIGKLPPVDTELSQALEQRFITVTAPTGEVVSTVLDGYAQSAQPDAADITQFTSEELHNIRQLAIDKLVELNTSPFFNYVHSALPSIRNKAQAELKRRGDWED